MKKVFYGIIIGLILGTVSVTYAAKIKYIQIPETISGYKTIDLLVYLAQIKKQADSPKPLVIAPVATVQDSNYYQSADYQAFRNTANDFNNRNMKIDVLKSSYNTLCSNQNSNTEDCLNMAQSIQDQVSNVKLWIKGNIYKDRVLKEMTDLNPQWISRFQGI